MKQHFGKDNYSSSENIKRSFLSRIPIINTLSFYVRYIAIIVDASYKVIKHKVSYEALYNTSFAIFKLVEKYGGSINIEGLNVIRDLKEPVVFIANHMSTLETQILPVILGCFGPSCFVVKKKLVEGRFFGPVMRTNNPIPLDRVNPRVDLDLVLKEGTERLSRDISVILFPQGVRTTEFDRDKFNSLGVKLAVRAGVKCVPIALKTDFWGNNRLIRGFGKIDKKKKIYMKFGAPIEVSGGGKKQHLQILEFIEENLIKWGHIKKKLES